MSEDTIGSAAEPAAHPAPLPALFYNPDKLPALFAALSAAQGAYKPIVRNKKVVQKLKNRDTGAYTGQTIEFMYAELSSVLDATREALAANGLTFMQPVDEQGGVITIHSILAHKDGGMVISRLPVTGTDMKNFGSNITYLRRYGAGPALGVASEDDADGDGEGGFDDDGGGDPRGYSHPPPATRAAPQRAAKAPAPARAPATKAAAPAPAPAEQPPLSANDPLGLGDQRGEEEDKPAADEPASKSPVIAEGMVKWTANKIHAAEWDDATANAFLAKFGPYTVKSLATITEEAFLKMRPELTKAAQ